MLRLNVRHFCVWWLVCAVLCLAAQPLSAHRRYNLHRRHVPHAHYSGITPLGGNRYAVVSDKAAGAGFYVWQLRIDSLKGRLLSVTDEGFRGVPYAAERDAEGIAFCPSHGTVFVSGEADQRVLEHRLDGTLTGCELAVPEWADSRHIQPNRGFEALCHDASRACLWTVTESPLRGDSALRLRLLSFGEDMRLRASVPYRLDAEQAKNHGRDHYHGVVALCTLPARNAGQAADDLLVLERECRIAPHYVGSRCWCKVFRFSPETGEKRLVASWQTRFHLLNARMANYEGMCPGPTLADGRRTLLLVSDSQGGYGRALWHLKDYLRILVVDE